LYYIFIFIPVALVSLSVFFSLRRAALEVRCLARLRIYFGLGFLVVFLAAFVQYIYPADVSISPEPVSRFTHRVFPRPILTAACPSLATNMSKASRYQGKWKGEGMGGQSIDRLIYCRMGSSLAENTRPPGIYILSSILSALRFVNLGTSGLLRLRPPGWNVETGKKRGSFSNEYNALYIPCATRVTPALLGMALPPQGTRTHAMFSSFTPFETVCCLVKLLHASVSLARFKADTRVVWMFK
jgi:hypothetical protein